MNDERQTMNRSSRADETAEDIFARIQRRRALAMNAGNTRHPGLQQHAPADETQPEEGPPAAMAGESLADILRQAAAREASAKDSGAAHRAEPSRQGNGSSPNTGHSAFRNFGSDTSGQRTRPPVDYPLLVDEDGTPIDEDAPGARGGEAHGDRFPRSRTMRALLRYPTLTTAVGLAVAVPAATMLLRAPAARQTLLRIGKFAAEQEVWKYVRKLSK